MATQAELENPMGAVVLPAGKKTPKADNTPYLPNLPASFAATQDALAKYYAALEAPKSVGDLTEGLTEVGPYQAYDWSTAGQQLLEGYQPPTYSAQTYQPMGGYQATPYQAFGAYTPFAYNFADQYEAPEAYTPFQYTAPEMGDIASVSPLAEEIWGTKRTTAAEDIDQQFDDVRERTRDELIRTGKRPEQAAAILANIEFQQQKAKQARLNQIDVQEAEQKVGIAQTEQQLGFQKSLKEAEFDAATQENTAQELAQKYNLDIDAARYMVKQQAEQQQLEAGETGKAYDTGLAESQYGQEFAKGEKQYGYEQAAAENKFGQEFNKGEKQYAFEKGAEEAKYQAALKQWLEEQKAVESEKAWQTKYGMAQDVAQTKMSQSQADNAAKLDYANALLQGQQAQAQAGAQQATYTTNLTEEERKKGVTSGSANYTTAKPVKPVKSALPTYQSPYKMPGSALKSGATAPAQGGAYG